MLIRSFAIGLDSATRVKNNILRYILMFECDTTRKRLILKIHLTVATTPRILYYKSFTN